jgi:hypothetical protein
MSVDQGPFPAADRFPAAEDGPEFQLRSVGHSLDDLSPAERRLPPEAVRARFMWATAALIALIAFVGWLLVAR